jgi:hypothetical protein
MKNAPWKTGLIIGIMILIMPGCLDEWITTQIHPDGSLTQIIVFQGDSADVANPPFAFMKDEGWKKEWSKPEKDKFKLVMTKDFKSVEDLNKAMNPADTSLKLIRVNSTLHKKFRWFFTRFVYEETVLKTNQYSVPDYKTYLTEPQIKLLALTEEMRKNDPEKDSLYKLAENRFEDYIIRSMYEDFYSQLLKILKEDKSLTMSQQDLDTKKEEIYRYLVDSTKGDSMENIIDGFSMVTKYPDLQIIKSKYKDRFEGFEKRMNFYLSTSDDSYKFTIRMPGLLLQTTSPEIKGSETNWQPSYMDFFFRDYTMTAESRMVNTWAFIVAGLVLLIALIGLVTLVLKKK